MFTSLWKIKGNTTLPFSGRQKEQNLRKKHNVSEDQLNLISCINRLNAHIKKDSRVDLNNYMLSPTLSFALNIKK